MPPDPRLIYITCATDSQAIAIGRALVERRLAACANVIPGVRSIYQWQGEVCADNEVILLVKTDAHRVAAVNRYVAENHTYECPCVIAVPIVDGHAPYLAWIAEQTAE